MALYSLISGQNTPGTEGSQIVDYLKSEIRLGGPNKRKNVSLFILGQNKTLTDAFLAPDIKRIVQFTLS